MRKPFFKSVHLLEAFYCKSANREVTLYSANSLLYLTHINYLPGARYCFSTNGPKVSPHRALQISVRNYGLMGSVEHIANMKKNSIFSKYLIFHNCARKPNVFVG